MKRALILILFGFLFLFVHAQESCRLTVCNLGLDITGPRACQNFANYQQCLTGQLSGCTESYLDQLAKVVLDSNIAWSTDKLATLPCSASGLAVSVISLLLPVVTAFFKL